MQLPARMYFVNVFVLSLHRSPKADELSLPFENTAASYCPKGRQTLTGRADEWIAELTYQVQGASFIPLIYPG